MRGFWSLLAVGSMLAAGCACQPDTGAREWAARQSGVRTEQAPGRAAASAYDAAQMRQYEALAADDAWLAEYAAFVRSIRGSVASGDLTEAEGNRLIARQRRHAEAERLVAARRITYSYPEN